jgi:hypothetical protein
VCQEAKVHPELAVKRLGFRRATLRSKKKQFMVAQKYGACCSLPVSPRPHRALAALEAKFKAARGRKAKPVAAAVMAEKRLAWAKGVGKKLREKRVEQMHEELDDDINAAIQVVSCL